MLQFAQKNIMSCQINKNKHQILRHFINSAYSDANSDYANIINPIIETKRLLNPCNVVEDTHIPGKAWAKIYDNGSGKHSVIPKQLIKNKG